ncbi:MAG: site-specific DNA-methyltransferase, partial [Campylobacterales bacterium]|nr:site-specific DNA-methyltransferase [Campylobacterales bacterium]
TGNKDFIYNDRYVDKEDKYRHSKWLNFMEKRLNIAVDLLTKDGVIFASIDDNEYPRLIMLFEKIFGENNVKTIVVKMSEASGLKMGGALKNGSIPKLKEYIVIGKKDGIKNIYFDLVPKEKWDSEYNIFLENFTKEDKEKIEQISEKFIVDDHEIEELDNLVQKINLVSLNKKLKELNILKKDQENWFFENSYRIIRTAASESVHKLALDKKKYNKNQLFFVKSDFSSTSSKPRVQIIFAKDNLTQHPGDFWSDIKTTGLDNEGGVDFKNGKKPIKLIERLIKSINKDSITVLDFFAGSGTTGEVVLKLRDRKNIKFILCTSNDDNERICEQATYPRLTNSINQYGGNLRYFKTSLLKKSKSIKSLKNQLTRECVEMLCVKENIYNLVKETKEYKIFLSNDESRSLC